MHSTTAICPDVLTEYNNPIQVSIKFEKVDLHPTQPSKGKFWATDQVRAVLSLKSLAGYNDPNKIVSKFLDKIDK